MDSKAASAHECLPRPGNRWDQQTEATKSMVSMAVKIVLAFEKIVSGSVRIVFVVVKIVFVPVKIVFVVVKIVFVVVKIVLVPVKIVSKPENIFMTTEIMVSCMFSQSLAHRNLAH